MRVHLSPEAFSDPALFSAIDALGHYFATSIAEEWIDDGRVDLETAVSTLRHLSANKAGKANSMRGPGAWTCLVERWEREAAAYDAAADRIEDTYAQGGREAAE